jgi:hypothetical protein
MRLWPWGGFKRIHERLFLAHFCGLCFGEALVCPFGGHEKRLNAHSGTRWKLPPDRTQGKSGSGRGAIGRTCRISGSEEAKDRA